MAVVPDSEQLLGIPASWEAVRVRLRQYPLTQVLDILTRIGVVLANADSIDDVDSQRRIVHGIFGEKAPILKNLDKLERKRYKRQQSSPLIIFHDAQVVNCAKAALLDDGVRAEGEYNSNLSKLGQALLIVNSLIHRESATLRSLHSPDGVQDWELFMLSNTLFNAGVSDLHDYARSWKLYLSDSPSLNQNKSYLNFPAEIERLTGLKPDVLYAIFFAFHSHWNTIDPEAVGEASIPIDHESFFTASMRITAEESDAFFGLVSQELEALRESIRSQYSWSSMKPYSFVPLARRPLVRIGSAHYPLVLRFLKEKLTSGLYHLFIDEQFGLRGKARSDFFTHIGYVWEDYVVRLLKRAYCKTNNATLFVADEFKKYLYRKGADLIIRIDDVLLIIEVKATRFPLSVRSGTSWDLYSERLEDLVFDAAEQLNATVEDIMNGRFTPLGFQPEKFRRIFPIIASLETSPMNPLLGHRITARLKQQNWLQRENTLPLQILDPGELEGWETAVERGTPAHERLLAKVESETWVWNSFRNFCIASDAHEFSSTNQYLADVFDRITERGLRFFEERQK